MKYQRPPAARSSGNYACRNAGTVWQDGRLVTAPACVLRAQQELGSGTQQGGYNFGDGTFRFLAEPQLQERLQQAAWVYQQQDRYTAA